MGHAYEAAKYLDETAPVPEVKAYVADLTAEAHHEYAECRRIYNDDKGLFSQLRSDCAFHYPELKPNEARGGLVRRALEKNAASNEMTSLYKPPSGQIDGARLLFADDLVAQLFADRAKAAGTSLAELGNAVRSAAGSFARFVNPALDHWLAEAHARGAIGQTTEKPQTMRELAAVWERLASR